jgi:hypothetical protein
LGDAEAISTSVVLKKLLVVCTENTRLERERERERRLREQFAASAGRAEHAAGHDEAAHPKAAVRLRARSFVAPSLESDPFRELFLAGSLLWRFSL